MSTSGPTSLRPNQTEQPQQQTSPDNASHESTNNASSDKTSSPNSHSGKKNSANNSNDHMEDSMDVSHHQAILMHSPLPQPAINLETSSFSSNHHSSSVGSLSMSVSDDSSAYGQVLLFGSAGYGLMAGAGGLSSDATEEANVYVPSVIPSLANSRISTVSLGSTHALFSTDEGLVYTVGDNSNGEGGTGDMRSHSIPVQLNSLDTKFISSVSAGYNHSAVVSASGELLMFGNGELGQLGVNTPQTGIHKWDLSNHHTPVAIKHLSSQNIKIVKVVCGEDFTLCLSNAGGVFACGDASRGSLGLEEGKIWNSDRHRVGIFTPITALFPLPIVDIAAGSHHCLALTATGSVYAWGQARRGQTGLGSTDNVFLPKQIESMKDVRVVKISAGGDTSALISEDGSLYTFGANHHGQLGLGDVDSRFVPVKVTDGFDGKKVVQVALGRFHSLVLCEDHSLYGCGDARLGVLGIGVKTSDSADREESSTLNDIQAKRQKLHNSGEDESSQPPVSSLSLTPVESGYEDILLPTLIPLPTGRQVISIAAGSTSSAIILGFYTSVAPLPLLTIPAVANPTAFDMATLRHLLSVARENSSYVNVAAYISKIFSSPSTLNASFIPAPGATYGTALQRQLSQNNADPVFRANSLPLSLLSPHSRTARLTYIAGGIDVEAVEDMYKLILTESVTTPSLVSQLRQAAQKTISHFLQRMQQPHPPTDPTAYRAIAIIMQAPFLSTAATAEVQLLSEIAQIIQRMPPVTKKTLRRWWSCYSPDIFGSRLVHMIRKAIIAQLREQQETAKLTQLRAGNVVSNKPRLSNVNDETVHLVQMLALMRESSEMAGGLLLDDQFYVPVAEFIDMSQDFIAYIKPPETAAMLPSFSFCRFPFLLDPACKAAVLRIESFHHQRHSIFQAIASEQQPFVVLSVKRDSLVESTVYELNRLSGYELQRPLKIRFIGEEAIDEGGVSAEFFRLIIPELSQPRYSLFDYNDEMRHLWYNAQTPDPSKQDLYYIFGTILGLAAYNTHSVNVHFPAVLYKSLLIGSTATSPASSAASSTTSSHNVDIPYTLYDLISLDPRLGRSLQQLLAHPGNDVEEVFQLSFTVDQPVRKTVQRQLIDEATSERQTVMEELIEIQTVDLIPNGSMTPVTNNNRSHYVSLLTQYYLRTSVSLQSASFIRGFRSICQGRAMKLFTASDLEQLLTGAATLDFHPLKDSARYEGGYTAQSPVIQWLWQTILDLSLEEKAKFLVFTTGSSRAPLGGLGQLQLTIQRAGPDSEQVMTASTCFHTLLLPEYSTADKLKNKLMKALEYSEGFGLQ